MTHWPKEVEQSQKVRVGKDEDGKKEKTIGSFASAKLKNDSDRTGRKSQFPIDDYLDPSISSHRNEKFPLPPLSPPPPSPNDKAVKNADDLLQAANLYFMNISMDLRTRSRTLEKPASSPDEGSLSSSSLCGESNLFAVRKAVYTTLSSSRCGMHISSVPDSSNGAEYYSKGKKVPSTKRDKQIKIGHQKSKSSHATLEASHHFHSPEKNTSKELHGARRSITHSYDLAKSVQKSLRPEGTPKMVTRQLRVTDSQLSVLSKTPSFMSLGSKRESSHHEESEVSVILTTDLSSPSSTISPERELNLEPHGRKPPPNSPASSVQSHPKGIMRALRINRSRSSPCMRPRVLTASHRSSRNREIENGPAPCKQAVDIGVGPDTNVETRGVISAVDVGVNTSYSLLKGAMVNLSGDLPKKVETGKVVSKQTVRFSLENDDHLSDEHKINAEETYIPTTSPVPSTTPAVAAIVVPSSKAGVSRSFSSDLNVSEFIGPRFTSPHAKKLTTPNSENHMEEEDPIVAQRLLEDIGAQNRMDEIAQNISYDELVEDVSITRELLSPKETDTSAYISGNSLTAFIENILLSEFKKAAKEAHPSRSTVADAHEEQKEKAVQTNNADRENENYVDEPLENKMKRLFLEAHDSVEEDLTVQLERVYTPQMSPSPVDLCNEDKEVDDITVPTPPLSPHIQCQHDDKKLEECSLIKVTTPPTTPKRSIDAIHFQPNADKDMKVTEKIPPTPRSQLTDSNLEESVTDDLEVDSVSTPILTPSFIKMSAEQLLSPSISLLSAGGKLEAEDPLPHHFGKTNAFVLPPQGNIPSSMNDISKPLSPAMEKEGSKDLLDSAEHHFSIISKGFSGEALPLPKLMIECETQTDPEQKIYPSASAMEEPEQLEKYQDFDTTTSFSMDVENEDNSEAEKSTGILSVGELKFKSTHDIKVVNLDSISMGEIVPGKMVTAGTTFECFSSGALPTSSKPAPLYGLAESWSEGEIREKWAVIRTNVSSSTASDRSKSLGEVSDRAHASISSEGELLPSDQEK